MVKLSVELVNTKDITFLPKQAWDYDAGFDVRARLDEPIIIPPNRLRVIPTGIAVELSEKNYEVQVRSRSGLATKGLFVLNSPGTVDYLYREEIKVILFNISDDFHEVVSGDRIAQICVREVPSVTVEYVEEIEKTARGGFGSTGVK